jgi:hypothetical protein
MAKVTRLKKPRRSHVSNLTSALFMCSRFSLQRGLTDPAATLLTSAKQSKHVPRFSLEQMEGRSQNGLPFSLIKSLTQYGLLTVSTPFILTLKIDSSKGFRRVSVPNSNFKNKLAQRIPTGRPYRTRAFKNGLAQRISTIRPD